MEKTQNQHGTMDSKQAPPPYESSAIPYEPVPTSYGYNQPDDVTVIEPNQLNMMRYSESMPSNTAAIVISGISIFFCLCLGIPALIIAAKANKSGNPKTAKGKLSTAWGLAIAAIVIGIILTGINIGLKMYIEKQKRDGYYNDNY